MKTATMMDAELLLLQGHTYAEAADRIGSDRRRRLSANVCNAHAPF